MFIIYVWGSRSWSYAIYFWNTLYRYEHVCDNEESLLIKQVFLVLPDINVPGKFYFCLVKQDNAYELMLIQNIFRVQWLFLLRNVVEYSRSKTLTECKRSETLTECNKN
jgi:hypothetical protein